MPARSITRQLTLLFAVSSTLILLAVGAVVAVLVNEHFVMLDVEELEARLAQVPLERASAGDVINATPSIAVPATLAQRSPRTVDGLGTTLPFEWKAQEGSFRGLARRVERPGGHVTILAAVGTAHHAAFLAMLYRVLSFSLAAGIALSVALGWVAARRGTAPIRRITGLAAGISAERLGERLSEEGLPSELVPLSRAFNAMLARLEDSFRRLSEFSADLAHELRTPITDVMTQTQVAVLRARSAEEYREILYSNLEEFQQLARIVEDMLFLARSENGLHLPACVPVDLRKEAVSLAEFFEAAAAERDVRIECTGEGAALGDRLMIRRALANLLSNALRHGAAGEAVRIELSSERGIARAAVENRGPDVAPQHLPRLFDRFYRVDRSRGRSDGGSGLGLAITKAISLAHGGNVAVRSEDGLTRFTLSLPAADYAARGARPRRPD